MAYLCHLHRLDVIFTQYFNYYLVINNCTCLLIFKYLFHLQYDKNLSKKFIKLYEIIKFWLTINLTVKLLTTVVKEKKWCMYWIIKTYTIKSREHIYN